MQQLELLCKYIDANARDDSNLCKIYVRTLAASIRFENSNCRRGVGGKIEIKHIFQNWASMY